MSDSEDDESSKLALMKSRINKFIKRSMQSNVDRNEVRKGLTKVYTELLFSKELYEWALDQISLMPEVSSTHLKCTTANEENSNTNLPLFCEDTVYHASVCCNAIATQNASNYKNFFQECNHNFEEVSMSRSKDREDVDHYLIAKKGKIYFIAFLSEPLYSKWPKNFESFEHGKLYNHS